MRFIVIVACAALVCAGCKDSGSPSGVMCTTEARVGLQISVRDAVTGLPAANNVIAIARDNSFVDTLRAFPFGNPDSALTLYGLYERPGVYAVILKKSGYQDWIRTDVVLNKDQCHVITVQLEARLQPN